ncbi:hypothetical protein GQ53DRAFT_642946 [Thozetella sp. PMI_491]|nr:hypothetical protein GQ53DRAFT_642946 [Thozetella sp. PMI_491]
MVGKDHGLLVDHYCSFCCKEVEFGTHDYCPQNFPCPPVGREGAGQDRRQREGQRYLGRPWNPEL